MNFPLQVTFDGETSVTTLHRFQAENEGTRVAGAAAELGQPGDFCTVRDGELIWHLERLEQQKAAKRIARFKVDVSIDGAKSATVEINRKAQTIAVRLHKRRTLYELPLADVAALIFDRVSRANAGVGRLKARRRR